MNIAEKKKKVHYMSAGHFVGYPMKFFARIAGELSEKPSAFGC